MRKVWLVLVGVVVAAVLWHPLRSGELRRGTAGVSGGVVARGWEGGGTWLNSQPLVLSEVLQKPETKAVLVDFWTYSCINCQRTIPYLRSWWEKYKDKGLVIVGVHSPEFEFEKEIANVQMAIDKYGVGWPVVQDNQMKIWRAYGNNYWPHKYLINPKGEIVYDHIGEGGYAETEREIQKLLGTELLVTKTEGEGAHSGQTPELYLNQRGQLSGNIGKGQDKAELMGKWDITEDYAQAQQGAGLRLPFTAEQVNLVMSAGQTTVRPMVRIVIDAGEERTIEIKDNDLYILWKGEFGKHILEMSFDEGVRAHAFTFGK